MDPPPPRRPSRQGEYALAVLTHSARPTSSATELQQARFAASRPRSGSHVLPGPIPTNMITNPPSAHNLHPLVQTPNVTPHGFAHVATRLDTMETLAYGVTPDRHYPYMPLGYHHGLDAQMGNMNGYGTDLGILNAETYDDGRHPHDARAPQADSRQDSPMPFGITQIRESNNRTVIRPSTPEPEPEPEKRAKRKRRPRSDTQNEEDDEEARKKARGRPRVDTKDETAADRRRTQIRNAQRAYRSRKETTISSLETQVQELRGVNEEMSNIFISLYDLATEKGLLQREPEFGQILQSTTERFLTLVKGSGAEEGSQDESHAREPAKKVASATEIQSHSPSQSLSRASSNHTRETRAAIVQETNPYGGYTVVSGDEESTNNGHPPSTHLHNLPQRQSNQAIINQNMNQPDLSFEAGEIHQYRMEVPQSEPFLQSLFPQSQPPLPSTGSTYEFSFARRIHRGTLERALKLVTSKGGSQERFREVFGFCMLYETRDAIETRLRARLASSSKETLQEWRAPFVHLGGAGTYYPMHDSDINGEYLPRFRTGFSMGPFSPIISDVARAVGDDMRCSWPGFDGEFFDANDVEGYLRGRGLEIPPSADFITASIDLSAFPEISTPNLSSISAVPSAAPNTPISPVDRGFIENSTSSYYVDFEKASGNPSTFHTGSAQWNNNVTPGVVSETGPPFIITPDLVSQSGRNHVSNAMSSLKRLVTINVQVLLDEIMSRGVCLGRAPGFRVADINSAIIAAVQDI